MPLTPAAVCVLAALFAGLPGLIAQQPPHAEHRL